MWVGRNNPVAPVTDRPGGSAAGGRFDHARFVDDKVQATGQVFERDWLIFEQDTQHPRPPQGLAPLCKGSWQTRRV